nr:hypothetical protein [Sphingomonas sp. CDS-1]
MASPLLFTFALWALLLTPGPTNSLMALVGGQKGLRRAASLIPAELGAYLIVVIPLAMLGKDGIASWLSQAIKLGAAIWVLHLALKLWRAAMPTGGTADITARQLFVTTLLNPKGLIIGLVLLPAATRPAFASDLLILALSVIAAALLWAGLGAGIGRVRWLPRIAAAWLALLSGGLALGAMAH